MVLMLCVVTFSQFLMWGLKFWTRTVDNEWIANLYSPRGGATFVFVSQVQNTSGQGLSIGGFILRHPGSENG